MKRRTRADLWSTPLSQDEPLPTRLRVGPCDRRLWGELQATFPWPRSASKSVDGSGLKLTPMLPQGRTPEVVRTSDKLRFPPSGGAEATVSRTVVFVQNKV